MKLMVSLSAFIPSGTNFPAGMSDVTVVLTVDPPVLSVPTMFTIFLRSRNEKEAQDHAMYWAARQILQIARNRTTLSPEQSKSLQSLLPKVKANMTVLTMLPGHQQLGGSRHTRSGIVHDT